MDNIHNFKFPLKGSETFKLLVVSDVHYDSKNCDRELLKKHFKRIKAEGGKIIIIGDLFDVMGCKRDPRSIPGDIRPEYMKHGESYLDLVIKDMHKFLKPYAENILVMSYGNHETNIVRRNEVDVMRWLVHLLNQDLKHTSEHQIELGAYQGVIHFQFNRTKQAKNGSVLYYHHGSGGGAKRSKGILNADILVAQNPFADVIVSGHDHNKWYLPYHVRTLTNQKNNWIEKKIDILRTGSYKKKSKKFGWEIEKDFNEPTLGGWLINYEWLRNEKGERTFIKTRVEEI